MPAATAPDRIARITGAIIGLGLAAALILLARPAGGHGGVLPASLSIAARQDGAVAISPAAPRALLQARALRPGDRVAGAARLTNQTGRVLRVRLRAAASSTALDGLVMMRISAGGRDLADTTLQGLRSGSRPFSLPAGGSRSVRVLARLPLATETGYEGSRVKVALIAEESAAP